MAMIGVMERMLRIYLTTAAGHVPSHPTYALPTGPAMGVTAAELTHSMVGKTARSLLPSLAGAAPMDGVTGPAMVIIVVARTPTVGPMAPPPPKRSLPGVVTKLTIHQGMHWKHR